MTPSPASQAQVNDVKVAEVIDLLRRSKVPAEAESSTHEYETPKSARILSDCYFAIVAICHQTTPLGERRLVGHVKTGGIETQGWDYLKERFLYAANSDAKWANPQFWQVLTPTDLSNLYEDSEYGCTLNRINERALLLNELGERLVRCGFDHIDEAFRACHESLGGSNGFLEFLSQFQAYKDPVRKKSYFFLSIARHECGWSPHDMELLKSPIDYHELRGHLRIGTVAITGAELNQKIRLGLTLTEDQDTALRTIVQGINDHIAGHTGLTSSRLHYLLWNVFRNCCPRPSDMTHCSGCGASCKLPAQYKAMPTYHDKCLFADVCASARTNEKVGDPPYAGTYY